MNIAAIIQELKEKTTAEIHFDSIHRNIYSVDASIFEIKPLGVVIPKSKEDVIQFLKIARKFDLTVIPRGAATGITGGCIGKGVILDLSKYLNRILEINYVKEYAVCEPGVVQDQLNAELASRGYRLGPDTSTGNRATIGGMMANNSAGARSLFYGKMVDHVTEVELALYNGELISFGPLEESDLQKKCSQNNLEGNIYREIARIRQEYPEEIKKRFPTLPRRASGYNLDELLKPGPINLSKIITGSEGTLGIATSIKVNIAKIQKPLGLSIILFNDVIEGMNKIPEMLTHKPMAIEMIDDQIINMGKLAPSMRGKLDWLKGSPKMVFAAEFCGSSSEELLSKLQQFQTAMQDQNIGYGHTILTDPNEMNTIWEVRKSGLGLLLSKRTYSRAIAFIEDLSIAPWKLASFMSQFLPYLKSINKEAGIYGHVGSGCMHIRPYIDLRSPEEAKLLEKIMLDVSDMVLENEGALTGEHGDGIIRAWLNKKMFGPKIYQAFIDLKKAFDPENRMNPGKIIEGQTVLENLRLSPDTKIAPIKTFLDFSREGGFDLAVDLCNGNANCRKKESIMCPSFQVTNDEYDSTRARAQTLRTIVNGRASLKELTGKEVHEVMDLCIECKGCKTECPSQVDMAKMKSEVLYQYQEKNGYSLRSRLFGNIGFINKISSPFAKIFNTLSTTRLMKSLLSSFGISKERSLPKLATRTFSDWFKNTGQKKFDKQVVLFNDTFNEYNEPEIGISAVKVLNALGYEVIVPPWTCCGRPLISKGMLRQAKDKSKAIIKLLLPYASAGLPIIGLEPSCILTIKDDYDGLLGKEAETVSNACMTLDEFLNNHIVEGKLPLSFKDEHTEIKLHGHCHQKALVGMLPTINILKAIPGSNVSEIPSGCCGMAGSFGYEKEHYTFSMKIGELKLFPAVRASNTTAILAANGISCRTQIAQGTGRKAKHIAQIFAESLEGENES